VHATQPRRRRKMAGSEIVSELRQIRRAMGELVELQRAMIAVLAADDEQPDGPLYDLDGAACGRERDQTQPL
jgi:hypothetical protein